MTKYVPTKGDVVYVIYSEGQIRQGEIYQPINKGYCLIVISKNVFIEGFYGVNFFFTKQAAEKAVYIKPVMVVENFIRSQEKLYAIVDNKIYRFILSCYKYEYLGDNKYNIGKQVEQLKSYELGKDLFISEEKARSRLKEIEGEQRKADEDRNFKNLYKVETSNLILKNLKEPNYDAREKRRSSYLTEHSKQNLSLEPKIKTKSQKIDICSSCGIPINEYGRCGCS